MAKSTKKRLGRPPGRKAPHRPVLSVRVPEEVYERFKAAAQASGRTLSEEVVWRTEQSFEWEKQFRDIPKLLDDARRGIAGNLRQAMIEAGYTPIRGYRDGTTQWAEPGSEISEAVKRWLVEAGEEPK